MATLPTWTENGTIVLGRSMRDSLKNDIALFGKYNKKWNDSGFAARQIIGPCMELMDQSNATTENAWHAYYLENWMNFDKLERLGAKWAYISGLADEIALAHVIIHALDETWDGYNREEDCRRWMDRNLGGPAIIRPAYKYDTNFAIDLAKPEAGAEHGFVEGYQIKPASFFESKHLNWVKQKIAKQHVAAEALGLRPFFINADEMLIGDKFNPIHHSEVIKLGRKRKI